MNKILTGSRGLVGQAILRQDNSFICSSTDLTQPEASIQNFTQYRPEQCIMCAAHVAGIGGHKKHTEFLEQNTLININTLNAARLFGVKDLLALSSVAAFPQNFHNLREDLFQIGEPHEAEYGYSLSKQVLDAHIQLIRKEYGLNYCCIIPTNIYGTHDNFNLQTAHVIPSLIHKIYLAKKNNVDLMVWGDGRSLREFIFADDLATILCELLYKSNLPDRLIVAYPQVYNIRDIVDILVKISDFEGHVYFTVGPNGLRSRECDTSRLKTLVNNKPHTDLEEGLEKTWEWFCQNYPNVRL